MVIYFFLLLATGRLQYEWFFATEMVPYIPRYWRYISIAPGRALIELLGMGARWNDPYFAMAVGNASIAVLGTGYIGLLVWLRRRRTGWLRVLELAILAYPLLSPMLEFHHFVWILPALLLQMRRWAMGRMHWAVAAALLAGWVTIQLQQLFVFHLVKLGRWVHYVALMGYLIIMIALIAELVIERRARQSAGGTAPAGATP